MAKAKKPKKSTRREVAAEATRTEILRAARRLFSEKGYAATSIADIAETAGVSVPTLYTSIGPKKAIVLSLARFLGEEAGSIDAHAAIDAEDDPRRVIAIAAGVNRRLLERCGDVIEALVSASHVEPDAARALEFGKTMHRAGVDHVTRRLEALGALGETSAKQASDVVYLLTDIEVFGILVRRCGWSFDRAEEWLSEAIARLVLDRR